MIDYRIDSWYNITNVKICASKEISYTANHPKFISFLQYAFGSGIPADSVIEITVTKPGQEPVTSNIRVLQSDLELLESLKDLK